MMSSFLSRKKAAHTTASIPPRPAQPQGLDITTISLPGAPPNHSKKAGYQGTYRPADYSYTTHGGLPSPPITPDAHSMSGGMQHQQNAYLSSYDRPSQPHKRPPGRMPSIEKLAVHSPNAAHHYLPSQGRPTAQESYYSTSPARQPAYDARHDSQSSSLSSSSSDLLSDPAHDRSSSATTASSQSTKSYYRDSGDQSRHQSAPAYGATSHSSSSRPDSHYQAAPLRAAPAQDYKQLPAPIPHPAYQAQPHRQQAQPAAHVSSQHMVSEPSSSTATMTASPSLSCTSSLRKTSSRYALVDFNFIKTLGTGSFGRVHLVRSCHNSRYYAVKVLNKERVVKMKQVEHTNSEREMLERVRHPFLVNLWGTFKDSANLYMVMDFVSGGELFSLLRKSQRFPDPVAKFFAAEVALALDYLHSLDIIYRDLKPENILLAADGHVKITDFGFAKYVPDITWTLCGTPDYLAPEIVQSRGYNKSVDWYALGVLIFEMLAGFPPFFTEDPNPMRLYEKITAGKVKYPAHLMSDAKDLLKNLLTTDLTKRYGNLANGSRDVFAHTWFAEVDWERLYKKEIPAPYVPRIDGDGDASCFESYAEIDISEYGQTGADPHGHLFALF